MKFSLKYLIIIMIIFISIILTIDLIKNFNQNIRDILYYLFGSDIAENILCTFKCDNKYNIYLKCK